MGIMTWEKQYLWNKFLSAYVGLPWWLRQWRICLQYRRPRLDPWVRKIPWRREWQPTPVFLPGESNGQRSRRLQSMGLQRDRTEYTHTHTHSKLGEVAWPERLIFRGPIWTLLQSSRQEIKNQFCGYSDEWGQGSYWLFSWTEEN